MKLSAFICFAIVSCWVRLNEGLAVEKKVPSLKIDITDLPNNPQNFYLKAQEFFNSIFGNVLKIEVTNQKFIKGLITFMGDQELGENVVVHVSVLDVSLVDAPSVKLAESIYTNMSSFPIEFSIPLDASMFHSWGQYTLSVVIKKNDQLRYISDTQTDVTDKNGNILEYPVLIMVIDVARPIPLPVPVQEPVPSFVPGLISVPVPSPPILTRRDTIKGFLVCSSAKCLGEQKEDQLLTISIKDVSLADAPSRTIARKEISLTGTWKFPLSYEIEFDSTQVYNDFWRSFAISATIVNPNNLRLTFISDTRHEINNRSGNDPAILKNIDINIVSV